MIKIMNNKKNNVLLNLIYHKVKNLLKNYYKKILSYKNKIIILIIITI